jgi:elongation factor Tu
MKSISIVVLFTVFLGSTVLQERASAQEQEDAFAMDVQNVFPIADGGLTIIGVVASGTVSVGDTICLISETTGEHELKVTGIEMFRKILESATAGDQIALLVTGAERDDIAQGDRLAEACS